MSLSSEWGILSVEECVERAFVLAERPTRHIDEGSYRQAYGLALRVIKGDEEIPLAAIQGPPGSGKTHIVVRVAEEYLAEEFFTGKDVVIYIAPTNRLTWEACARVLSRILRKLAPDDERERCRVVRELPDLVRVLGYKIRSVGTALRGKCGDGVKLSKMVDLKVGEFVRLMFTTEFQRPYIKSTRDIKLIVDESSKFPYFQAFIPLIRRISSKEFRDYPVSMIVLGDPQQAIMSEGYGRDILLINVAKKYLGERNYIMLDLTFRLPEPSERPISVGFYEGRLRSVVNRHDRLKGLSLNSDELLRVLSRYVNVGSDLQMVVEALEEAINNRIPLVVFETPQFEPRDTLDRRRAKLGFYTSLALSVWLRRCGAHHSLVVTSIYTDLLLAVGFELRRRGLSVDRMTVQALIGDERDFVATMLGKEYRDVADEYAAMYAREPELLNVQFSRHRALMAVIGCVNCLSRFPPRPGRIRDIRIRATGETLVDMIERGEVVYRTYE